MMELLRVERHDADVDALVGDLFRRVFHHPPPDQPIHFVTFLHSGALGRLAVGYCHFTALQDCYLGGGMCFDERVFRRLSAQERAGIRRLGGIARFTLRSALAHLGDKAAVFGYVGDKRAERIDRSLGFEPTAYPRLLVHWNRSLPPTESKRLIDKVGAMGPF